MKFLISIGFVLFLSWLAERISPSWAGIISGVPTGTAIILFFYGIEQGPRFAADSAIFNLAGMVAMQAFLLTYYLLSRHDASRGIGRVLIPTLVACSAYAIVALLVRYIPFDPYTVLLVPIICIPTFTYIFDHITEHKIVSRVRLTGPVLLVRSIVAASVIVSITMLASIVGPSWAGLLSAFPTTLLPLILILHVTYDAKHAHTVIKNVPKGQWAMAIYALAVYTLYPLWGTVVGTLVSYAIVLLYLFVLWLKSKRIQTLVAD